MVLQMFMLCDYVSKKYLCAACVSCCGGQARSFGDDLLKTET